MSNYPFQNSPQVSFHFDSNISTNKKLSQTEDCKSIQSRPSDLVSVDLSMFSTTSNSNAKRLNQIMPKGKPNLKLNPKSTKKHPHDDNSSQNSEKIGEKRESMQYASIKPFFNWKKFTPLCGFEAKTGEDGCLCGNPCPLTAQWTKNYKESDCKLYQQLLNHTVSEENRIQIEKDILRTHPECLTFSDNVRFQDMLKEVLQCFSVYDPQVGYVQGMNMIVGVILYHVKNSELAFWAFVDLMDQKELRMIYLSGFEYLHKHQNTILDIMDSKVHDLVEKMSELDIIPQSFLNGWILSLMGTCIPLEYMHEVVEKFRRHGWNYIYQLIITYLLFLKEELMRADDQAEFLMSLNTKNSRQYGIIWEEMVESALKFPLNKN